LESKSRLTSNTVAEEPRSGVSKGEEGQAPVSKREGEEIASAARDAAWRVVDSRTCTRYAVGHFRRAVELLTKHADICDVNDYAVLIGPGFFRETITAAIRELEVAHRTLSAAIGNWPSPADYIAAQNSPAPGAPAPVIPGETRDPATTTQENAQ